MEYFQTIYYENLWKNRESISGDGSTLKCSEQYIYFLEEFIRNNKIKKILDLGCGDFNLMQNLDFTNIEYTGLDMIKDLVYKNNKKYSCQNIKFIDIEIHDFDYSDKYDLILCKDVLQHWSNESILNFHKSIKNYVYCILTNDFVNTQYYNKTYNVDIVDSEYTILDLTTDPFHFEGEYIFEWQSCETLKKCFLLKK